MPQKYRWVPIPTARAFTGVEKSIDVTSESFVCDEDGNIYVPRANGLTKLSSELIVIWEQPAIAQAIAAQKDGYLICSKASTGEIVRLASDGSVIASTSSIGGARVLPDGGLVGAAGQGIRRLNPDLSTRYTVPYPGRVETGPDGVVYVNQQTAGRDLVHRIDDDGNLVMSLDITSYRRGSTHPALLAVARDYCYISASDGNGGTLVAAIDFSGNELWRTTNDFVSLNALGDDGRFVGTFYDGWVINWYGFGTGHFVDNGSYDPGGYWDFVFSPSMDVTNHVIYMHTYYQAHGEFEGGVVISYSPDGGSSSVASAGENWSDVTFDQHGRLVEMWPGWMGFVDPATGISVSMDVALRRGTAASIPYGLEFVSEGGLVRWRQAGHSSGEFVWSLGLARGNYEVIATAKDCLRKVVQVAVGGVQNITLILTPGDINGDNRINLFDLAMWFGEPVDLNNDGHAGLMDLSLILLNFNMVGDS